MSITNSLVKGKDCEKTAPLAGMQSRGDGAAVDFIAASQNAVSCSAKAEKKIRTPRHSGGRLKHARAHALVPVEADENLHTRS